MWQVLGILVNVGNGRIWLEKVGRPGKFSNSFRGARSRKAEKAPSGRNLWGLKRGLNYHLKKVKIIKTVKTIIAVFIRPFPPLVLSLCVCWDCLPN